MIFVLINPPDQREGSQIIGYSNIQDGLMFVVHDINVSKFFHFHWYFETIIHKKHKTTI